MTRVVAKATADVAETAVHIKADSGIAALTSLDTSLATRPELQAARTFLRETPFAVAPTRLERRKLLDLADWASNIGIAQFPETPEKKLWSDAIAAEKYGYIIEGLFANPFVQDQLLGNPAKWKSLLKLGALITAADQPSPRDATNLKRQEALAFLKSYDAEWVACQPRIATPDAKARNGKVVAGTGDEAAKLFCEYSLSVFKRRNLK